MSKKIATLWDANKESSGEDHDEGQTFYAGGSEHSGQQILGPDRSGRMIGDLLSHAQRNSEHITDSRSSSDSLPVTFWRNGFTVGDEGTLRSYKEPENMRFMEHIRNGETPPELARTGTVNVKLEDKSGEDYQARFKAFSGQGHRLGAPAPETEEK